MGSFLSDTLSQSFSSKYAYFKIHDSNIAKYSKCTGREKTSEKRDIKFLSFQICVVTNLFEWYRQKLLAGKYKENSQIFNEDFYLPLYLPLCSFPLYLSHFPPTPHIFTFISWRKMGPIWDGTERKMGEGEGGRGEGEEGSGGEGRVK